VNTVCVWGKVNAILISDISGMILKKGNEVFRIILSQCQIVQKDSHMAKPGIGAGTSW
jgi:hypothetical protein